MERLGIAVLTVLLMFTAAEAKPRKAKSADATKAAATEKKSDKKSDKSADKSAAKADINTSSEADLEAVKGIGPATAKKIIAGRPYASIDDLKKAGLSAAKIDQLRGSLTVSAAGSAPAATSTKGSSSSSTSSSGSSSAPAASTSSSSKPSMWERLRGKKSDNSQGSAQPATSASGSSSSSGANTGAATTQSASASNTPQAPGGGNGKVWVNKDTKVFHREGDRWYGKTKNGEYMTERDAIAQGYRPVKEREKKQ